MIRVIEGYEWAIRPLADDYGCRLSIRPNLVLVKLTGRDKIDRVSFPPEPCRRNTFHNPIRVNVQIVNAL